MALVSVGYEMTVTFIDDGANTVTRSYSLRGADFAAALVNAGAILTRLAADSLAVITAYRISQQFEEDALVLPTNGSQVEVQALVTGFIAGQGNKKASFNVPAPVDSWFVAEKGANSNIVNVDAGSTAQVFANIFRSAGNAFISDGETLDALLSGVRATKGKRGG